MQLLKQSKHEMGFKEASLRVTVGKPDTLRDNAVQLHVRGSNALGSSLSLTVRLNEETFLLFTVSEVSVQSGLVHALR